MSHVWDRHVSHMNASCPEYECVTSHCNTLHDRYIKSIFREQLENESHCNTLQHTATHCNTLQHTATHCATLQHRCIKSVFKERMQNQSHSNIYHTATHCNTLQKVQHAATEMYQVRIQGAITEESLGNTATHCNTRQHTATHGNTLQHTATHCNTGVSSPHSGSKSKGHRGRRLARHTHINASCPIYECIMSHIWITFVTHRI